MSVQAAVTKHPSQRAVLQAGLSDSGVGGAGPLEAPLLGVQTAVSFPHPHRAGPLCVPVS